jgi:putative SOS response-associated peptidase YedK
MVVYRALGSDGPVRFARSDGLIWFAGCYVHDRNSPFPCFAIFTRPAAPGEKSESGFMPVVVPTPYHEDWLRNLMSPMECAALKQQYEADSRRYVKYVGKVREFRQALYPASTKGR